MSFPRMPLYVRNDPFGPNAHNNLLQRQDHLTALHSVEHDPVTGEHNTPHVARDLGYVAYSAGYTLSSFRGHITGVSSSAVGTVTLTLAADVFEPANSIVEIQPADDSGNDHAWFASVRWVSATELQVFLKKNTAAVGSQQVLAATDGKFFIAIRSSARSATAPGSPSFRRVRGDGLAVGASDWNPSIQRMGDNRHAMLQGHTAAGLHDTREVSKAWARVRWDSDNSSYSIVSHQGIGAGIVRLSQGVVRVYLANCVPTIVAPVQAFARVVSDADGTTAHSGLRTAMIPEPTCGASSVDVYLYASTIDINFIASPVTYSYEWVRLDGDFFIRVHGA